MKKFLAVVMCVLIFCTSLVPTALCAKEEEFHLEIDVNKRNTDISILDESDAALYQSDAGKKEESRKNTYIAVLVVALVISVIVLVFTLKRVPPEEKIFEEDQKKKDEESKN